MRRLQPSPDVDLVQMVGDGGAQAFDALRPFSANSVWTVRDGKVARARFFADREAGLRAAGLRDRTGD